MEVLEKQKKLSLSPILLSLLVTVPTLGMPIVAQAESVNLSASANGTKVLKQVPNLKKQRKLKQLKSKKSNFSLKTIVVSQKNLTAQAELPENENVPPESPEAPSENEREPESPQQPNPSEPAHQQNLAY